VVGGGVVAVAGSAVGVGGMVVGATVGSDKVSELLPVVTGEVSTRQATRESSKISINARESGFLMLLFFIPEIPLSFLIHETYV